MNVSGGGLDNWKKPIPIKCDAKGCKHNVKGICQFRFYLNRNPGNDCGIYSEKWNNATEKAAMDRMKGKVKERHSNPEE